MQIPKLHFQLQHLFQLVTVAAIVVVAYTWHEEHQAIAQQNQDLLDEMKSSRAAMVALDSRLAKIGVESFFSPFPLYGVSFGDSAEAGWIHDPERTPPH